jgi:hypothetical protein
MADIRVFLSHTSELDEPPDGSPGPVDTAIRTIAALPGFSVEEQSTTFTAEDASPAEVCRRRLGACDIYVGIIGSEPGTGVRGDPKGRSFVELEFDVAGERGIPRIVLLWDPEDDSVARPARTSAFRSRLESSQDIVFERCRDRGGLRVSLERTLMVYQPPTSDRVWRYAQWASEQELSSLNIDPRARRWAIYVRNTSDHPARHVFVSARSNNGGKDFDLDWGIVDAGDVRTSNYVLNEEVESFDPDGDVPVVEMWFTLAGIRWHQRRDGTIVRDRK